MVSVSIQLEATSGRPALLQQAQDPPSAKQCSVGKEWLTNMVVAATVTGNPLKGSNVSEEPCPTSPNKQDHVSQPRGMGHCLSSISS